LRIGGAAAMVTSAVVATTVGTKTRARTAAATAPTFSDVVDVARRMPKGRARDHVLGCLAVAELRIAFAGDMAALGDSMTQKYRHYPGQHDQHADNGEDHAVVAHAGRARSPRSGRRALGPGG
jgi:hypothetical protein